MMWYWNHYLSKPEDGANPYASPLRAANVKGLPPAFILTAEFDPLRDDIFRSWVRFVSRWHKRSSEFTCLDLYERLLVN